VTFLLARERVGRYVVQAVVGRGATGVVYRARAADGREVALKLADPELPAALADEVAARYRREVEIGAQLAHPAIAAAVEGGLHDRRPYVVLRLAPGEPLSRVLAGGKALPEVAARAIAATIADALAHAHARKIVHRDVKPSNVIVSPASRASGRAWLCDLGLARAPGVAKVTRVGAPLGALGFAPPEQLKGVDAGAPSDLFGLGIVLYVMLTGVRPFACGSVEEYEAALAGPDPRPPSAVAGTDPALDAIVTHCLSRDPRERARSAADVAIALRAGAAAQGGQ